MVTAVSALQAPVSEPVSAHSGDSLLPPVTASLSLAPPAEPVAEQNLTTLPIPSGQFFTFPSLVPFPPLPPTSAPLPSQPSPSPPPSSQKPAPNPKSKGKGKATAAKSRKDDKAPRKGRRPGAQGYSDSDLLRLGQLTLRYKPIGPDGWKVVARKYNKLARKNDRAQREVKALRTEWDQVSTAKYV